MAHILSDFKAFLDESPTSWHAVVQLGNRFAIRDFIPLKEGDKWDLEVGKRYFVARGGTLCAAHAPGAWNGRSGSGAVQFFAF